MPSAVLGKAGSERNWRVEDAPVVELSVVVPSFNEELRLPHALIEMIDWLDSRGCTYEIIVVDDGSRDGTSVTARQFERIRPQVKVIRLPVNRGKGHAVRTGALNSRGSRVLFADADGATPFAELARLEEAIAAGADVAIGSRAGSGNRVRTDPLRRLVGRLFNAWVSAVLLRGVADTQCGFKLFTRGAAEFLFSRQESERFSFDVEILYIARRAGMDVREVPVHWSSIPGSKVSLLRDAARMLLDVPTFRWRHRGVSPGSHRAAPRPKGTGARPAP